MSNLSALLLLGILASSFLTGVVIFFLNEEEHRLRTWLNLLGAGFKILLVAILLQGVANEEVFAWRWTILPGLDLALGADSNSVLFVTLSAVLWFFTTVYAVGYLEHAPHRSRFFGFLSMCVSATTGIALSANMFTLLVFYELLTVTTYPLVVHRGTPDALRGGRTYLTYTLAGGAALLAAVAWLYNLTGTVEFHEGGELESWVAREPRSLQVIFFLFVIGFGVKAALVPLHGWLPKAMVAPAPVSSLLHAVAVVKAGAFGMVRLVFDLYGVANAEQLGVLHPLLAVACITIVYGSVMALFQDSLKKRLAYSTVSQVSYILVGTAMLGPLATMGGLIHLVHQGIMKITLFFCAGNFAETYGIHRVREMNGLGRVMPLTCAAFTLGALGMMGVPPLAGYITKWYLQAGAVQAGHEGVVVVLTVSTVLNAAYFLPIIYRMWFLPPQQPWTPHLKVGTLETHWMLLLPPLVTAAAVIFAGVFAESSFSPLAWVKIITAREYAP